MNEEQIMVFSKERFEKHNKTLCWFANAPVIKYWFRWLLKIHNDIPFNTKINQITPNSFSYNSKKVGDKIELTTDFRTHEKFGKRLYYGLKPFWYLLHFWDWSTSVQPALNCGFDTLTVYPDAGTGNTTVCGSVARGVVSSTWTSLVTGDANYTDTSLVASELFYLSAWDSDDNWYFLRRSIFTFDTSGLTTNATISSAIISFYGIAKNDGLSCSPTLDIYTTSPTANNNLQNSDYGTFGTTSQTGSPIAYSSFSTSAYNNLTFNSTGIGNISKTSISKFGTRNANYDVTNSAPSWVAYANSKISAYFSDQTGTTNDPKLVITYSLPTTFIPRIVWF